MIPALARQARVNGESTNCTVPPLRLAEPWMRWSRPHCSEFIRACTFRRLVSYGAKSLEKAIEVQSDYVKSSYEGFVAEATKLGELYTALAKEAYKPFESQMSKVAPIK